MLSDFTGADKVYIACGYMDLRRGIGGIDGLIYNDVVQAEEESTPVAAHKRHKKHEYTPETLPEGTETEQIHHRLEEDSLVCPSCGETMTEIGTEVVRTLEIIPAKTVVKEHIYHTYACRKCSKEGTETPIVKAPREKNIIPGSFATPEAIAHIIPQGTFSCC